MDCQLGGHPQATSTKTGEWKDPFHCSRNDLLPPKSQPTLASSPPPQLLVLDMYMTSPSPMGHTDLHSPLKASAMYAFLLRTLLDSFWTVVASSYAL